VGARISDVDHVAIGRSNDANLLKKVRYALSNASQIANFLKVRRRGSQMRDLKAIIGGSLETDPAALKFKEHHIEHHLAHVASAFFCSPWERAAGLSYDGSGDFVTTMRTRCEGTEIEVLDRVFVPHSLGHFYAMICDFIGYRKYGDEGKIMGLAPYGNDTYYEQLSRIVFPDAGAFRLDLTYFLPFGATGMSIGEDGRVVMRRHYSDRMKELFGEPAEPYSEITQREMDLAYSMQRRFEEMYFELLHGLHARVPYEDMVMAGGCALNSVANGKTFTETPFRRTWIQPAAGDEGLAVGAALYAYHSILKNPRRYVMKNAYLGPEFSEERMRQALDSAGLKYERLERAALLEIVSERIKEGDVVGWFQGRMEWGPRALGNRSILAHPGLPDMKDVLNARIKRREWFRPFAPSILEEYQSQYFEHDHPSPFMLHVYKIRAPKRTELCAVNHVDNTGRLQTVKREENPLYYDLIDSFRRKTGIPVVLNTSFNENEPIVCAPEEAVECFVRTKMDLIALGPYVSSKAENRVS
jgi:carbamoyltransferase